MSFGQVFQQKLFFWIIKFFSQSIANSKKKPSSLIKSKIYEPYVIFVFVWKYVWKYVNINVSDIT